MESAAAEGPLGRGGPATEGVGSAIVGIALGGTADIALAGDGDGGSLLFGGGAVDVSASGDVWLSVGCVGDYVVGCGVSKVYGGNSSAPSCCP